MIADEANPSQRTTGERDPMKQIKVKLPIELVLRLQEIRITEGRSVGEVVKEALTEYLERTGKSKPR